jgi:hypothetical protein
MSAHWAKRRWNVQTMGALVILQIRRSEQRLGLAEKVNRINYRHFYEHGSDGNVG